MCVCTMDICVQEDCARLARGLRSKIAATPRPKLFNWISVILMTAWVVLVSAVAHSVPSNVAAVQISPFEVAEQQVSPPRSTQ